MQHEESHPRKVSSERPTEAGFVLAVHFRQSDGSERTAELEFERFPVIDLEQSRVRYHPGGYSPYDLLEFRNERGESLAVLSSLYLRHEVRST
jgi:hypothetical protein